MDTERESGDKTVDYGEPERDPEREWKNDPHPWASAGWARLSMEHTTPGGPSEDGPRPFWEGFAQAFARRALLAAVLFAGVWGMFRSDEPWALTGQAIVTEGLTRQMDFAAAEDLYRRLFAGTPTFIPIFDGGETVRVNAGVGPDRPLHPPVPSGVIVRPYPLLRNGVEIAPPGGGEGVVEAAETGRVTLVDSGEGGGVTVVLTHAAGRSTVYGQLRTASVAVNDWVEAGERIGTLPSAGTTAPGHLYFAVKENGAYVDPADRLPHD